MSDFTPILQEMAERADATEMPAPHEIRRAAERHRRRLAVATATCAVLGTVAAGLFIRGVSRDAESLDPAGPPSPSASLHADDRVGFVGPPPLGISPTGPATGELVAAAYLYSSGTWVYADGRIINVVRNGETSDEFRGYAVRQLTPSGVEAMRSFLLDGTSGLTPVDESGGELIVRVGGRLMFARDFKGCGAGHGSPGFANAVGCPAFSNPEDWLPADAWEDPAFRPFVPHAYELCLTHKDLAVLPAKAAAIFLASPVRDGLDAGDCRAVATSDASTLIDTVEDAGAVRDDKAHNLEVDLRNLGGGGFVISPILPDGRQIYCNCG
jgi:hypothetical protein